jgi:predicted O-methyltransferase YrrM
VATTENIVAQAARIGMLAVVRSVPGGLVPIILLLGAANGMSTLARATTIVEVFGPRWYASIAGAVAVGANGARALGPVSTSVLHASLGGYEPVFWTLCRGPGADQPRPRGDRGAPADGGRATTDGDLVMDDTLTALLDELARFGEENDARETERAKRMLNITPDTGRLLWILVGATRATRILEVGTSNAYSTIWLADAARAAGGEVTTLERNADKVRRARENLTRAGLADRVEIREGPAAESLAALPGPFDFVFLDADRPSYRTYLDLVVPKMVPGALLVADNVVSHREELADYLARVESHPDFFSVTVPIGKGEELALKLR